MTLSTTSPGDERAEYERWLRSQHKARFWNTSDAMFAAWQAGRASSSTVQQVGADALDAARWRRLVNASEMPFPVATIADDPENDCTLIYGRTGLERLIDSYDEISDTYQGDQQ